MLRLWERDLDLDLLLLLLLDLLRDLDRLWLRLDLCLWPHVLQERSISELFVPHFLHFQ